MKRICRSLIALACIAAVAPAVASAHAVVFPKQAAPGAYERYVVRVPNEKNVATTFVEIAFPAAVRVVSFGDVDGWTLEVVRDSAQRIVGAKWRGTLQPERFVELPFIAVNPNEATRLTWPVHQTYADGERVAWTGPEGSDKPASFTDVGEAGGSSSFIRWAAIAALMLSFASLGLALRKRA